MDFITKPFGWLMMVLFEFTKNYGLAVILFALVVKGILLPFQMKGKRGMMRMTRLQPKVKELEKKHGANKQKYNEEVQKLYREEKVNPASGCLWNLLPFPIIIALYSAIRQPLSIMMGIPMTLLNQGGAIYNLLEKLGGPINVKDAYIQIKQAEFISNPANFDAFHQLANNLKQIDYTFLGMNLGQNPQYDFFWKTDWSDSSKWLPGLLLFLLPVASGILAYFSSKISMKMNPSSNIQGQQQSSKMMLMMMPLMSVYFAFIMPGAIGLYIIASTLFAMIQDIILTKHYVKIMDAEDVIKNEQQRIKEAELEAKRLETERKKIENNMEKNPNTSKKKQQKTERQIQQEKAAEWEKKNSPAPKEEAEDPSRIGTRRFARGRAYDPSRFGENTVSDGEYGQAVLNEASTEPEKADSESVTYDPKEYSMTFENEEAEETADNVENDKGEDE